MKNLTTFVSAILLVFSTTACSQYRHTEHTGAFGGKTVKASKNYVTKNIKVDNFTGLNLAGKPEVEVYTSDNIVDLLDINVANNTLNIRFKKGVNVSFNKLEIRIFSETLNSISIAGAGNIELANGLKTDHLKVSIAGSGDIQGSNITCTKLKTSIAGSGDLKLNNISATNTEVSIAGSGTAILTGKTREASYRIAGSGDLFASDLQAERVSASVSGSGDIKCHATDFLKARTSGSGDIGYKGNPELDVPKKGLYKL